MVQFRNEIDIDAPVPAVFDELSDVRNEMRWSPQMRSVELITDEPIRVGSHLRAQWAGSPMNDVVYLEHQRPERWVTESTSWMLRVVVDLEIKPVGRSSRLISTWTINPRGPFRLMGPVFKRIFNKEVQASMRSAKVHVESLNARGVPSE